MFGIAPLLPADGRDYKSKAAAQADLDAGKDFLTVSGQRANKSDLILMGHKGQHIQCRNANKRKVFILTIS